MKYKEKKASLQERESIGHHSEPQFIRHTHHALAKVIGINSALGLSVRQVKSLAPDMWRTGLRGSIYEVQCECLAWLMIDSKLITPPAPVTMNKSSGRVPMKTTLSLGHGVQYTHIQQNYTVHCMDSAQKNMLKYICRFIQIFLYNWLYN